MSPLLYNHKLYIELSLLIFHNSKTGKNWRLEEGNMKGLFSEMRRKLLGEETTPMGDIEDEYVELDTSSQEAGRSKVTVRPYAIAEFGDVKGILDALRDGKTIALVNIKPLKDKDLVELKRAINKLKKTCDAIEGDIAGFGDDYLVVTPSFAQIYRESQNQTVSEVKG